jgi:hypothetical protein
VLCLDATASAELAAQSSFAPVLRRRQ